MNYRTLHETLYTLYYLSRENLEIDTNSIGFFVGVSPDEALKAISILDEYDLVNASRMRLTMKGLVVAVSKSASIAGSGIERAIAYSRLPGPTARMPFQPYSLTKSKIPTANNQDLLLDF